MERPNACPVQYHRMTRYADCFGTLPYLTSRIEDAHSTRLPLKTSSIEGVADIGLHGIKRRHCISFLEQWLPAMSVKLWTCLFVLLLRISMACIMGLRPLLCSAIMTYVLYEAITLCGLAVLAGHSYWQLLAIDIASMEYSVTLTEFFATTFQNRLSPIRKIRCILLHCVDSIPRYSSNSS